MRYILTFYSLILATACSSPPQSKAIELKPITESSLTKMIAASGSPYVLVNFFATYCKPCEREMPALKTMADNPVNGIEMLFISLDQPKDLDQGLSAMFDRMNFTVPVHHYTLTEAEAFIRRLHPDWRGDIPLNLVFRNDGTFVKALGMTDPQEVTMVMHHDQTFRD